MSDIFFILGRFRGRDRSVIEMLTHLRLIFILFLDFCGIPLDLSVLFRRERARVRGRKRRRGREGEGKGGREDGSAGREAKMFELDLISLQRGAAGTLMDRVCQYFLYWSTRDSSGWNGDCGVDGGGVV